MRALILLVALLAGCQSAAAVKPAPEVVTVEVRTYVPIPKKLTARCPMAHGDLDEVVIVARKRKACGDKLNSQMDAIEAVQGTDVEDSP